MFWKAVSVLRLNTDWLPDARKAAIIENNTLMEDVICEFTFHSGVGCLKATANKWLECLEK